MICGGEDGSSLMVGRGGPCSIIVGVGAFVIVIEVIVVFIIILRIAEKIILITATRAECAESRGRRRRSGIDILVLGLCAAREIRSHRSCSPVGWDLRGRVST